MKTMKIHGNNGTKELNKNKKMIKEYVKNVKKMKMSIQERKKYVINYIKEDIQYGKLLKNYICRVEM